VIDDDRELLEIMTESIVRCGYEGRVGIYFDVAADCYYERDIDRYVGLFSPGEKSRDELIALLQDYVNRYPLSPSRIRSTKMISRGTPSLRASWASRWWGTISSRRTWSG